MDIDPLPPKQRKFVRVIQMYNALAVQRARPYKGNWYIFTLTPKGKRKDTLYLYEALFKELPSVKSIDYAVYIRECSDAGVQHLHGMIHSKSKSKFLKLLKSKSVTWLIHPYWDLHETYWLEYMGKCSPSLFGIFRKKTS